MRKKNTFRLSTILVLSSAFLIGCQNDNKEVVKPDSQGKAMQYDVSYYNNNDFNDYVLNGNSSIANQWEDYGLSSPYVLRFNGYYYLYGSTTSNSSESGVRAWKSRDLINWVPVAGNGLKTGYVVDYTIGASLNARAPEVYYYNGSFYMYESYKSGAGHFILKSDSPEGPFVSLTNGAIDSYYDGTLFFDKDENPYFITAYKNNINISTMESINSIIETNIMVNGTDRYADVYSESPSLFEYLGKYYLIYSSSYDSTGGYQISYAVSDGWENETPGGLAKSFREGLDNVLLMNADQSKGFIGLGHPSAVLGPDLDSYYMVYDCLDDYPYRHYSYNMDRLLMSGDLLTTSHNRFNSIRPASPAIEVEDENGLVDENGYLLSDMNTGNCFSVEYNFKNAEASELVFAYHDNNNYSYIKFNSEESLSLYRKSNGQDTLLEEVEFYHHFFNRDLHTVRLGYRNGKIDVYFENSLKMKDVDIELAGGKIGYKKADNLEVFYTCASNVARGLSNELEIKQSNVVVPAELFMADNQIEGVTSSLLNEGSVVREYDGELYKGAKEVLFKNQYDYSRYLVNFNKSSTYALQLTLNKQYSGKNIIVEIDDGEDIGLQIPSLDKLGKDTVTVSLGDFAISQGVHQIKIQNNDNEFGFVSFKFIHKTSSDYYLNASLSSERNARGITFGGDSRWYFLNDSMVSYDNHRNLAVTDEDGLTDFNISVEMNLTGSDSVFSESKEAGIILRCNNYVSFEHFVDKHDDLTMWNNRYYQLQGYYLAFTSKKISLYKMGGDYNFFETISTEKYSFGSKKKKTVVVKVRGNEIDVFIDNQFVMSYFDSNAYVSGSAGLYTTGAEVAYKNLKVSVA